MPTAKPSPVISAPAPRIVPEPNRFDDHFLDVVGNTFKFDHPKGLAEWLKNSADAYSTAGIRDDEQFVLLRFQVRQPKSKSVFECIDFVGASKRDIDDAVKIWGSPTAAKKGTNVATFGGHGNGGKFYMRQMFHHAVMVTYRNGLLNVFGFDEKHRYGFVKGLVDKRVNLAEALRQAEIDDLTLPKAVTERWRKNPKKVGFSVVRGCYPQRFSGRSTVETILEGLRFHPQARRLLRHKQILIVKHGQRWGERLEAPTVEPKPGFDAPREILLPKTLEWDGESCSTRGRNGRPAKLLLRTSEIPLTGSRELSALNSIDILGEVGCIGSYRLNELGFLRYASESEFIYGEAECAFLEAKGFDCVTNDRERLVSNGLTSTLLAWIREQVDALAAEIGEKRRNEKMSRDLAQSALFNQILDKWKNRFMVRLNADIFGGVKTGDAFGSAGDGGIGEGGAGNGLTGGDGRGAGSRGDEATQNHEKSGAGNGSLGGSGDEHRRASKFPRVLLSGYDMDPLDQDASKPFECDHRHPPVYQRMIDIPHGVYWINTSRPLAQKILDRYNSQHPRWREYLFQRYVEIILKQQMYVLAKTDPEFTAEKVDGEIDRITSMVHDAAAEDLEQFLFDENLTGTAPSAADKPQLDDEEGT